MLRGFDFEEGEARVCVQRRRNGSQPERAELTPQALITNIERGVAEAFGRDSGRETGDERQRHEGRAIVVARDVERFAIEAEPHREAFVGILQAYGAPLRERRDQVGDLGADGHAA